MKKFKNILIACLLAHIYYDACVGTKQVAVVATAYAFACAYMVLRWMDKKYEED